MSLVLFSYRRYLGSLGWEGVENEEYGISWTVNGPQQELVDSYKEMLPVLLERIQEEAQRGKVEIFVIYVKLYACKARAKLYTFICSSSIHSYYYYYHHGWCY